MNHYRTIHKKQEIITYAENHGNKEAKKYFNVKSTKTIRDYRQ